MSEQAVLIINSYSLTDEQKIAMLQKMKPTTFKKYSTYIYSKTKKGLTNIAKFTAGFAALVIIPSLMAYTHRQLLRQAAEKPNYIFNHNVKHYA